MDALIRYVIDWLNFIFGQLLQWLADTFGALIDWLSSLLSGLFEWIAAAMKAVLDVINRWVDAIGQFILDTIQIIKDTATELFSKFADGIREVIDNVSTYIEDVFSSIRNLATDVIDAVTAWIDEVTASIIGLIERGIEGVASVVERVKTTITEAIDTFVEFVVQTFDKLIQKMESAFDVYFGGVGSFLDRIGEVLGDVATGFRDAALEVVTGVNDVAKEHLDPVFESVIGLIDDFTKLGDPNITRSLTAEMVNMTSAKASADEIRAFIANGWTRFVPETGATRAIFMTVFGLIGAIFMMIQVAQISGQIQFQDFAKANPFQIFATAEAAQAWRHGILSENEAIEVIQRQGYTSPNAATLLKISEVFPAPVDQLAMMHRGIASDGEVSNAMLAQGFDPEWIAKLKAVSFIIPPVGDLITMAVREVFTPEIAKRFGQFEDFPPDFSKWAEAQGLSEDWAVKYWAAHWALPSPNQGFEMLHRGVITQEELSLLLRALDVMPFWRQPLIDIAFAPFTRVDIRRMHRVGVLDEPEVTRAYMDIGYNDEKSKKLTDFTLQLNAPPSADDEVELTALSRSSIVNFFSDGLLERNRAIEMLIALGFSNDAANLFISSAELDEERRERKEEIKLVLELVKARVLDITGAEGRLAALGLETFEIGRAIASLVREQQRQTKLPSRSEAERMFRAKAITIAEYEELLESFGYAPKWVTAFSSMLTGAATSA